MHVERNRRVAEHNSYPLEYQSFVRTPVHHKRQIYCRLKNLKFEWSRPVYIYYYILNGF
jgi:hypothetical protein